MVSAVSSSRNQTIGADSAQGGGGKKDDDKEVKYGKSRRVSAYVSHVSETEKRGGPGEGFKKKIRRRIKTSKRVATSRQKWREEHGVRKR